VSATHAVTPANLRTRLLRGSFFEIGGFGAQQILRLGSNLILTRLLFPAAFGLSAIVLTIAMGLGMISDLAVQPCVIQSKRGDELAFLNTAFTLQAMRGCGLALLMMALAKPAALFYHEPVLTKLVCLGSLNLVISGLHSTSIFTLRRRVTLGWINALDLFQSIVGTIFTILIARAYPRPEALIFGIIGGSLVNTVASHFLPVPYRNKFHWDKPAAEEIGRFGRWVFGSSAATFLGGQSDRILLGRFLGASWLGVYGIAVNLTESLSSLVTRVISGVLYPAVSHAARDSESDFSRFYYRLRLRLDTASMTATGLLGGLGSWIISTLWDQRYANAAWIVQVLCVRVAITLIVSPTEMCLFALGQTRYLFLRSTTRLIGTLIAIPLGWSLGGVKGVVWGTVIAEIPTIFAVWPRSRALGILRIRRELIPFAIFAAAYALGHSVLPWLPKIHLR
jgi:O-antigen/teichoic acid export membrane protein